MKRERLMELRARVFADCQEWDVKCSQDGFQEASPTGEMDADGKDLTALIDAEIARQSVKSEEVADAIDMLQVIRPSEKEIKSGEYPEVADAIDLAITALRQIRTEPCVWCKWTDNGYRIEYNLIDEDGNCCPDMDNVVVTGIATYCPNCGRKLVK